MKKTSETDLVKACLSYLEARGILAWRNNTGAVVSSYTRKRDNVTKSRFIRYGFPGSGDILGCLPGGKLLSVEAKKPKSRTNPDRAKLQADFAERIKSLGGVALRVESLDELIEGLRIES